MIDDDTAADNCYCYYYDYDWFYAILSIHSISVDSKAMAIKAYYL